MYLKTVVAWVVLIAFQASAFGQDKSSDKENARPIRALLICGGCCHDYSEQHKILSDGIQARANVQVDVWWTDDKSTNPPLTVFNDVNWANNYDVIIHDECAARNTDVAVMKRILEVHKNTPAVHLHCAMHSFRNGTDEWFKHLGLQSSGHGPHAPIDVKFVDKEHPIVKGLEDWTIKKDELYNNVKVFDAHALATGTQTFNRKGKESTQEAIVIWTNEAQGAKSFSMSIGHYNEGVADERYLNLVTRGMLWACEKLSPEYQKPFTGKNVITFEKSKGTPKTPATKPKVMPKNAKLVYISASSTENPNFTSNVLDGNSATRWCAENGSYPQWLRLDFKTPQAITDIKITWERDVAYQYKVLASPDGEKFSTVVNGLENKIDQPRFEKFMDNQEKVKSVRIEGVGTLKGGWCSIREVQFKGKKLQGLWPASKEFKPLFQPTPAAKKPDPNAKEGNVEPTIKKLTAAREAEILKDVKVPEGFEATLFASPPAVNYPVFVAAATDGTLFVSSDGNGSLGRDAGRGRVIRLRDLDGDGKADETKVFCKVDAPRGLVWDHDRLYLMHPPHLSAFIDSDGDGVADEQKILVKNLAFGYDKRPADHTTNGLSIGVDGYLYVAGGDFGFMDAEGTDGRKLTHRGGGVIRVRPDGTGLELYSTGTRNILEVAISPQMDMFARDNTNDGGGWDVRFHHFTGGDNHGYPRLYKNFSDECIGPLADYGGGSGCGAVFIDEPGFGEWNNAPFSADWGTGALFHHSVKPEGATFVESEKPKPMVRMTRPTDADVDGMSRLYCASWRGATFKWAGPEVGYIVQVRPKNYQPGPLPEFKNLTEQELIELFQSPSYRRRLEAQRELVRRGSSNHQLLFEQGVSARTSARNLAHEIQNGLPTRQVVMALDHKDLVVQHVAVGELGRRVAYQECFGALDQNEVSQTNLLRALALMHQAEVVQGLIVRFDAVTDMGLRQKLLSALCRLHSREAKWTGQSWGTRPDTRGPYYQPEAWSETPRIMSTLQGVIQSASPKLAMFLANEMRRNRIRSNESLERIVLLAKADKSLAGDAVLQLAGANEIPPLAIPFLISLVSEVDSTESTLTHLINALAKTSDVKTIPAMLNALQRLSEKNAEGQLPQRVQRDCFRARVFQNHVAAVVVEAEKTSDFAIWADAVLLQIASQKNGSPESKSLASSTIMKAWDIQSRRIRLMMAAAKTDNHYLDDLILNVVDTEEQEVSTIAKMAMTKLKLKRRQVKATPLLETMSVEDAIVKATRVHGDFGRGEQVFKKANCVACHTVSATEKPKGPYLGNISATYKRQELATAILQPNKTIAQGFKTNIILDVDGRMVTGYVTEESAEQVVMRDAEGKEFTFAKQDIEERKESDLSSMPEGLVKDFSLDDLSSLLDYLESVSKQNKSSVQK